MKLGKYILTQKTEAKMINNFKKTYGSPDDTVICIGDWQQYSQKKFFEPTKGVGYRDVLRKGGYSVYLVDEYKTSCRCSNCEDHNAATKPFRKCENPRPWKKGITIKRHGLVRCSICKGLWNRDTNASINIWKIAKEAIGGNSRPLYLQRSKRPLSESVGGNINISDLTSTIYK